MSARVDLYDSAYANYASEVYREVRMQTYGEDFGQTSWATTEESREIPHRLVLKPDSSVLELGCGSGGYALYVAETVGCRVVGLDINEPGVQNANQLAAERGLGERVHFERCDASKGFPFEDQTFDAVFSNDVLCHLAGRPSVLSEIFRILKAGGRMLFSDALVVGGMLSHENSLGEVLRAMGLALISLRQQSVAVADLRGAVAFAFLACHRSRLQGRNLKSARLRFHRIDDSDLPTLTRVNVGQPMGCLKEKGTAGWVATGKSIALSMSSRFSSAAPSRSNIERPAVRLGLVLSPRPADKIFLCRFAADCKHYGIASLRTLDRRSDAQLQHTANINEQDRADSTGRVNAANI